MRKVSVTELKRQGVIGWEAITRDESFGLLFDLYDGTSSVFGYPTRKPCEKAVRAFRGGALPKVRSIEIIEVTHDA